MEESSIGREAELATSARFLEGLERTPRALVLAGEAGIGKTTVWKQVLASARERGYWALSCRPTQSETALSFSARVGLVATMRTPDEEVLPLGLAEALSADQLDRVDVGPLSAEVLHRVVRQRLGGTLPRPTLVQIEQASGGNPFYALEIARSYREAGVRLPVGSHPPLPRR